MATIKIEHDFVECRDGKEREIFPFRIKDKDKVRHFTTEFNSEALIMSILTPDMERMKALKNTDKDVSHLFTDKPCNALMEILVLAFGEKYTEEEILSWIDESTIPAILSSFYMVSGVKKKEGDESGDWDELIASIVANTSMTPKDVGEMSFLELEALMEGMKKNSERERKELEEGTAKVETGDANDLLQMLKSGQSI